MSAAQPLDDIKARVEGHTEGPWRVWKHGHGLRSAGVETVWAHEGDEPNQITDWCLPADAELIAAAPKLLAALEAVEDAHQPTWQSNYRGGREMCRHDTHDWPCPTIRAITEALA